jgi:disulfide oxidoreductase YuzD
MYRYMSINNQKNKKQQKQKTTKIKNNKYLLYYLLDYIINNTLYIFFTHIYTIQSNRWSQ